MHLQLKVWQCLQCHCLGLVQACTSPVPPNSATGSLVGHESQLMNDTSTSRACLVPSPVQQCRKIAGSQADSDQGARLPRALPSPWLGKPQVEHNCPQTAGLFGCKVRKRRAQSVVQVRDLSI